MSGDIDRLPREALQVYLTLQGFIPMRIYRRGVPETAMYALRLVNQTARRNILWEGSRAVAADVWAPDSTDWRAVEWAALKIEHLRSAARALHSEGGIARFNPEDSDEY